MVVSPGVGVGVGVGVSPELPDDEDTTTPLSPKRLTSTNVPVFVNVAISVFTPYGIINIDLVTTASSAPFFSVSTPSAVESSVVFVCNAVFAAARSASLVGFVVAVAAATAAVAVATVAFAASTAAVAVATAAFAVATSSAFVFASAPVAIFKIHGSNAFPDINVYTPSLPKLKSIFPGVPAVNPGIATSLPPRSRTSTVSAVFGITTHPLLTS